MDGPQFKLKELVEVAPRTHPGFNFAGGTARISKVRDERQEDGGPMKDGSSHRTTDYTYDVKYVIGGSERRVDAQHITSKVLATRQELGDQRQEEQTRRREEREKEAARAATLLEEQRAERKRKARDELTKRRAAKQGNKAASDKKRTKSDSKKDDDKSRQLLPLSAIENNAPSCAPLDEVEESEELRWLKDVLLNRVPKGSDAPDEIAVGDVVVAVNEANDKPPGIPQSTSTVEDLAPLFRDLEQANLIMLVDDMIFLV